MSWLHIYSSKKSWTYQGGRVNEIAISSETLAIKLDE